MELEAQQEKFCHAYLFETNENGTAAAKLAGYSEKTATSQASRLLRNVKVKARMREMKAQALRESGYDRKLLRAQTVRELARIAFADVTDVIHISPGADDPNRKQVMDDLAEANGGQHLIDYDEVLVVPTTSMSSDTTAAIKSIKIERNKDGIITPVIEMHDKKAALLALLDYTDDEPAELKITGADGGPITFRWAANEPTSAQGYSSGDGNDDA